MAKVEEVQVQPPRIGRVQQERGQGRGTSGCTGNHLPFHTHRG